MIHFGPIPFVPITEEEMMDLRNDPDYIAVYFGRKITLHLILKKKWFDLISNGIKTEEYRERTPYWKKRIWDKRKKIRTVCFHCGYTNKVYYADVDNITTGTGKESWGAEQGKEYYILKLKGGEI